ncbi:cupin domain-containing protein [Segetibacter koreensis]|uniref:cupin domain-containing protein n=1 Tax=Segetibacter koreensis TaxID=398037 RepID=UPI00039E8668|nr:cupin domain-containing protein [Segetibacter koreensis]
MDASFYITHLNLQPHPEGGYFKENYRATESIPSGASPIRFNGPRTFSTAIYYLLQHGDYNEQL